jgi:hypothetical protein
MPTRAFLANLLMARGETREAEGILAEVELPVYPIRATQGEFDQRIADARGRGMPGILINTVPKSASESIWNRFAEGFGLAQGHISLCLYPDCTVIPNRAAFAAEGGLIAKEHLPASSHNLTALKNAGLDKVLFHLRDPRQVVLSWTHFVRDDVSMRLMGPLWRKVVPPASVLAGDFNKVLDWSVDNFLPMLVKFVQGWQKVAEDREIGIDVQFFTFEHFLEAPDTYFKDAFAFLGLDPAQFNADAEAEIVHLRRGEIEEWREIFSIEQKNRAWHALPADLAETHGWRK